MPAGAERGERDLPRLVGDEPEVRGERLSRHLRDRQPPTARLALERPSKLIRKGDGGALHMRILASQHTRRGGARGIQVPVARLRRSMASAEHAGARISVACVGAGWVTRQRHIPALRAEDRVDVVGVVDKHPERAEALARANRLPNWGRRLDEGWLERVQAVMVGTPPLEHGPVVEAALERDLHCLCEKPLAFPASSAAGLVQAAGERGRVLAVVHNFQFSRAGARLFSLVEGGDLGAVSAVYGFQLSNPRRRLPTWYHALPGGLFLDEAPHLLYLMRRLLGRLEPRTVDGRLDGTAIRDLSATFEHDSIWASLTMSFGASVSEWQLVVVAERGVAALDVFRDVLVVLPNDGAHRARDILRSSARMVGGHIAGASSW